MQEEITAKERKVMANRMRHPLKKVYSVGNLRVYAMDHIPCDDPTYYPVKSSAHAKRLIDALAESQLLDPNITDNCFGLEVMDKSGEWNEWDDEEGNDISAEDVVLDEYDGGRS